MLREKFTITDSKETFELVERLFGDLRWSPDKKAECQLLAEIRTVMDFREFTDIAGTYRAVEMWLRLSRRKVALKERGITVGSKIRNMQLPDRNGTVVEIRDDLILKVVRDDGSRVTAAPTDVEVIS